MSSRRDFRVADTRRARVILIEAGPRLLPALHADSSARALKQLHGLGVEVRLGKPVTAVFADGVEVGGERLHSYNVIWAAGVRASPLVQTLGAELGPGGRVKVLPDCSVPGHPNVFVIGDAAYLVDSNTGQQVPGVSQGALQMGRYVAQVIEEELRAAGAQQLRAARVSLQGPGLDGHRRQVPRGGGDRPAALRRAARLVCLAGAAHHGAHRVPQPPGGALSWIYSYVFFRRGSRLITGLTPAERQTALESRPATSVRRPPPVMTPRRPRLSPRRSRARRPPTQMRSRCRASSASSATAGAPSSWSGAPAAR